MSTLNSETLRQELDMIAEALQVEYKETDTTAILEHGLYISAQLSRVASIKADCLKIQRDVELIKMQEYREQWKTPMVLTKLINASTGEEQSLVELADSVFSAMKHRLDFFRSVISKYKEELAQNRGFNQVNNPPTG